MSPGLSLPACLAIARLVERTAPFDPDFALLVIAELGRELRLEAGSEGDDALRSSVPSIGGPTTRAGRARRMVDAAIAEIRRRVGAAATPDWRPVG